MQLHQSDRNNINDFIKSEESTIQKIKFDENINKIKKVITENKLNSKLDGAIDFLKKNIIR